MFQNSTQSEIFVTEKYPKADFNFFLRIIRVFMETALEIIFESKETVLTKNTVWWLEKESHYVEVEYHLLYLLHYGKTWFPTCQVSACPAFLEEMNFYSTVLFSSWITRVKILKSVKNSSGRKWRGCFLWSCNKEWETTGPRMWCPAPERSVRWKRWQLCRQTIG